MPIGGNHTIVALAGRRVDASDASAPAFPLDRVPAVRRRIRSLLVERNVAGVISSAACGADLIAQQEAGGLGLLRRIVLPYQPDRFRQTSVTDRPGGWGPGYDDVIAAVRSEGGLLVLDGAGTGDEQFRAANHAIIRGARAMASDQGFGNLFAVLVWEGRPREGGDATEDFRRDAVDAGFDVHVVPTLPSGSDDGR